jgi:hypothetical protein
MEAATRQTLDGPRSHAWNVAPIGPVSHDLSPRGFVANSEKPQGHVADLRPLVEPLVGLEPTTCSLRRRRAHAHSALTSTRRAPQGAQHTRRSRRTAPRIPREIPRHRSCIHRRAAFWSISECLTDRAVTDPARSHDVGLELRRERTTSPRPLPRHGLHDEHPPGAEAPDLGCPSQRVRPR